MITKDQFRIQIDRLCDTFSDNAFSDQRVAMIWDIVDGLAYPTVIAIVDGFISSAKHAPLPDDFKKAAHGFSGKQKRNYALGEVKPFEEAHCKDCGDSGLIRLQRKYGHDEWARYDSGSAPCHCHRGAELIEAGKRRAKEPIDFGPQFGEHWLKSYGIVSSYTGRVR